MLDRNLAFKNHIVSIQPRCNKYIKCLYQITMVLLSSCLQIHSKDAQISECWMWNWWLFDRFWNGKLCSVRDFIPWKWSKMFKSLQFSFPLKKNTFSSSRKYGGCRIVRHFLSLITVLDRQCFSLKLFKLNMTCELVFPMLLKNQPTNWTWFSPCIFPRIIKHACNFLFVMSGCSIRQRGSISVAFTAVDRYTIDINLVTHR